MTLKLKINNISIQQGNKQTLYGSVVDDAGNPIAGTNILVTLPNSYNLSTTYTVGQIYTLTVG